MTEQTNYFEKMNKVNVSEHIEKKGKFSYLSWPFAVQQLGIADPTATWEVIKSEGLPYLKTELGYFVEVTVTIQGVRKTQIHPVLDASNKVKASPTAFDINTSIQRCLVKAIALHGLGLYIYAGEDLPEGDEPKNEDKTKNELKKEFPSGHEKVPGTDKTVGQVVDENLAMEKIPEAESRDAIRKIAKAIEGDFYTLTAKAAVERLQKERAAMNETEYDALWGAMPATLRANLKKCEDAMRTAK